MSERKVADGAFEWETLAAALSFVGAAFTGLFGFLLTTSWIVVPSLHPQVRGLGIVFLMVAFPLLILAGHCLDLLERRRKQDHAERFQKSNRGSITVSCIVAAVMILTLALVTPLELRAQQTIFSMPTTDVLDRSKMYAELDAPAKTLITRNPDASSYTKSV